MLAVKEAKTAVGYPEVAQPPCFPHQIGAAPWVRSRWRRGIPKDMRAKIAEAVPTFGMAIKVYAPGIGPGHLSFLEVRADPLVIGERDGKLYLIAAWE